VNTPSFPNPVGWAVDKVAGAVGGVAGAGLDAVLGGLTHWVVEAVVWVVGGVFSFFFDATDPNVQADWFLAGSGPYATTAGIAAVLLVGFVLVGIVQGALAGDAAGMLRRVGVELPLAVVAMVGLVGMTQALIALTDALADGLLGQFRIDVAAFTATVSSLGALLSGGVSLFVIFVLGVVAVLAGIVLVAELVVRASLIYIVVALAPLVLAAQLWPALRGAGRKLAELLVALILSKLVIAVALAVAAAAAVGAGSGGEVTALAAPEVAAADSGGAVGQAVGILLAAAAAFGVAAFSPLLVVKLLPFTEAAVVAAGVRGGPVRAAQQAASASYYASAGRARLSAVASQPATSGPAGQAGAAAAGPAGAAAAAANGAAGAARRGSAAATSVVDARRSPPPDRRPPAGTEPARRRPSGRASEGGDGGRR
jgi:hypothetical protein